MINNQVTFNISPISSYHCSLSPILLSFHLPYHLMIILSLFRSALCGALTTAAFRQDKSPALLETLASSLLASFSSSGITTSDGRTSCSKILLKISSLSRKGFLGDSPENLQQMADLVSSYTVLNNGNNSDMSSTRYPVNYAVSGTRIPSPYPIPSHLIVRHDIA
jgi:hypothetical protein